MTVKGNTVKEPAGRETSATAVLKRERTGKAAINGATKAPGHATPLTTPAHPSGVTLIEVAAGTTTGETPTRRRRAAVGGETHGSPIRRQRTQRSPQASAPGKQAKVAIEPAYATLEIQPESRPEPAIKSSALPQGPRRKHGISPENTVFVSLCFEGPDVYSTAGGLGTRVTSFTETLARQGYETHLIFVGDPDQPNEEMRHDGRLRLVRWGQWISRYYPNGVYEGEEHKLYDYAQAVPQHIYEHIARPAVAAGKIVVIIGEDWHTAETMWRTSDLLHWHGIRERCVLMWNCNSLKSLHRIDWGRLNFTTAITTVSRYMKQRLWQYNVNPLVIPNGIPSTLLGELRGDLADELRGVMQRGDPERLFLFKIGRFDPDKRWLMAVEAAARLKASGRSVALVMRGGMEPHGGDVIERARRLGLTVRDVEGAPRTQEELIATLRAAGEADVYNLQFFLSCELTRLCYAAADATLANSGHEPFGLVGLEVMAAGGVAFTGSTGEDYAISFENAVALETDDPDEIVGYLTHIVQHPEERAKLRAGGKRTAATFVWEEVVDNLLGKLSYLARKQNIVLE